LTNEHRGEEMSQTVEKISKRRGMFAMGAALLGAAAAKLTSPAQVQAAPGDFLKIGFDNDAGTAQTKLTANVAGNNTLSLATNSDTGNACVGENTGNGGGLVGSVRGTGTALAGVSDLGIGLSGTSFATLAARSGVGGFSSHGYGVRGGSGAAANEEGGGVFGEATAQPGVKGTSVSSVGVLGVTTSGLAGQFNGPVVTNGNLNVNGDFTATGIKSAAVRSDSGSLVRLYCQESPEAYFEDFGQVDMPGNRADVALRADFAALVDTSTYQVFLTEYEDLGGVYALRGVGGFSIISRNGKAGSVGYRIVAHRKDVKAGRLAPVQEQTGIQVSAPRTVGGPQPGAVPPSVPGSGGSGGRR
jgi:hypothetical protein